MDNKLVFHYSFDFLNIDDVFVAVVICQFVVETRNSSSYSFNHCTATYASQTSLSLVIGVQTIEVIVLINLANSIVVVAVYNLH